MATKSNSNSFLVIISNIQIDKLLHFFYGSIIAIIGLLCWKLGAPSISIFLLPLIVGVAKEIYDHYNKKVVNIFDLIFTIISGTAIYLIIEFIGPVLQFE